MAGTSVGARHGVSSQISPDLIIEITQSVIEQLQTGQLDKEMPLRPSQKSFPPPSYLPQPIAPSDATGIPPPMPHRSYDPPSPHHPLVDPNCIVPPRKSRCPRGEQKAAHFSGRRSSPPSSESSATRERYPARPRGPPRLSTEEEITTLERIWGPLFDEESSPTLKLGQLLRGLAVHIIEDYEPRHSIVITPTKMAQYYEDVKLSREVYLWSDIFDGNHSALSQMYRDLRCPHHLIQEKCDEMPDIPGLTQLGFARWVTLLIQAHPEEEFERLQQAVLKMPISNPDDRTERFPKEISRRLFPDHGDRHARRRIQDSMTERAIGGWLKYPSQKANLHYPDPPSIRSQGMEDLHVNQSPRGSVRFADPISSSMSSSTHAYSRFERENSRSPSTPEPTINDNPFPSLSPTSRSVARERKRDAAPSDNAQQFQGGRSKPRSKSLADPPSRLGRNYSTTATHPISLNTGTRRPTEDPQPGTPSYDRPANGASRRH